MDKNSIQTVLLDVEGTVAPISFVYDVLFPYARDHLESSVEREWSQLAGIVDLFRAQSEEDVRAGLEGVVPIPDPSASAEDLQKALIASARWQMATDRKTQGLKALQGRIWKVGFESGTLRSVVFPDVPAAFRRWKKAGLRMGIYSSGSVEAQRLFFRYSEEGDLCPYLSGHFDTRVGAKRVAESYVAIAGELGVTPESVIFATDVAAEADAAEAAGMKTVLLARPGNPAQPEHDHRVLENFDGFLG